MTTNQELTSIHDLLAAKANPATGTEATSGGN